MVGLSIEGVDISVDWYIGEVFGKDMAAVIIDFYKLDSLNTLGFSSQSKATNTRKQVEMSHKYLCSTLHIASDGRKKGGLQVFTLNYLPCVNNGCPRR